MVLICTRAAVANVWLLQLSRARPARSWAPVTILAGIKCNLFDVGVEGIVWLQSQRHANGMEVMSRIKAEN
jgi:hypothetical protein